MTTETAPNTVDQLAHDLADAQTIIGFLTRERDEAHAERDALRSEITHYVAAVTDSTMSAATLHLVLARLAVAECELLQWRQEATARQREVIRQRVTILELEQGCDWLAETVQVLEADIDLLAETSAHERRQAEEL